MFIFTPGNIGALWPDHITYDKANQLVSSECNGKITKYEYDAAGRLVKEGKRSYSYSWLDKVSSVKENGVEVASFSYHMDGQIATAKANGRQENFLWDNLALISRNETEYVNEPYVTGGNPILADEDVLFNDLLGSTIGIGSGKEYRETGMTAFGETDEKSAMFTGKPYIGELGYAFLFRNYRPEQGKWQTADPLGYPDGWNNLAYCNNDSINSFDLMGCLSAQEKQTHIMNQLHAVAKSNMSHSTAAQALLNATLSDNSNPLVQYITNASDSISDLNSALPSGAPGKSAIDTLSSYLSAGKSISQAIELANNQDPRFMSSLLELSGAKNLPGIGSYIDFIDGAINAIAAGISQIKLDATMQYIDQITDPTTGDFALQRIIDSGWLIPKSTYDKYLRKLQE